MNKKERKGDKNKDIGKRKLNTQGAYKKKRYNSDG